MASTADTLPRHEERPQHKPRGDFEEIEASRSKWRSDAAFSFTQVNKPEWQLGDGASDHGESLKKRHIDIDPYEEGRPSAFNYKLLISAIIPRPVAFVSTQSKDGSSTNLSPFSYFQLVNSDPPVFVIGFSGALDRAKDSLRNLVDTGECCINIISEHFLEAANATAVNAPYQVSEWALTGLTPATCKDVKPSRVQEAIFSVEAKLMRTEEFESRRTPGKKTGVLVTVEGVRFWAREDAINEERNLIDPAVLRPVGRLGGISYARINEAVEIPRLVWDDVQPTAEAVGLVRPRTHGQ